MPWLGEENIKSLLVSLQAQILRNHLELIFLCLRSTFPAIKALVTCHYITIRGLHFQKVA